MNAVGQPISRVDGRRKVTGGARYTADISATASAQAAELRTQLPESHLRVSLPPSCCGRPWLLPSPFSANRGVSPVSSEVVCVFALVSALSILTEFRVAEGAPAGHSRPWPIPAMGLAARPGERLAHA